MSAAPAPGPDRPRPRPAALLAAALLLPFLVSSAGLAAADEPSPGLPLLQRVVQAWGAGDEAGVLDSLARDDLVQLDLLSPRVRGTFKRGQALTTLKAYFEQVGGRRLVDVTSRRHEDAAGYCVRHHDYTYRRAGEDPVVTRLTITVKTVGEERWVLDSVRERTRPTEDR